MNFPAFEPYLKEYGNYLRLERSLSPHSVDAYLRDIGKLCEYLELKGSSPAPAEVGPDLLREFITWINGLGLSARSQARILSGLRSFFRYLLYEEVISSDPTTMLDAPRTGRKLPEVLSVEEIDRIIGTIDLSKPEGRRNRAIIETLYSCGLRVSELLGLRISNLYLEEGYIRVTGKGNKERLVPIGGKAVREIRGYMEDRKHLREIAREHEDILYLNRRGRKLSRVMVYTFIREYCLAAGIRKKVSPHTFRHSFATHLIDGGADLRAVQEMLGHESILTTEIYTHLDREYLRSAIIQFHPRSR